MNHCSCCLIIQLIKLLPIVDNPALVDFFRKTTFVFLKYWTCKRVENYTKVEKKQAKQIFHYCEVPLYLNKHLNSESVYKMNHKIANSVGNYFFTMGILNQHLCYQGITIKQSEPTEKLENSIALKIPSHAMPMQKFLL